MQIFKIVQFFKLNIIYPNQSILYHKCLNLALFFLNLRVEQERLVNFNNMYTKFIILHIFVDVPKSMYYIRAHTRIPHSSDIFRTVSLHLADKSTSTFSLFEIRNIDNLLIKTYFVSLIFEF